MTDESRVSDVWKRLMVRHWSSNHDGSVWKLVVDRRLRYSITYLGRTQVAFGGGQMRWKVQNHRNVEGPNDIPEFHDLDEAKAWVLAINTLEQ